jgi:uncharacterized membrane protein SirB2
MTARSRVLLDLALFGVLLVAYNPSWTGLALHEWLCAAALVPLLVHLVINWDQTVRLAQRFAEHLRHLPRVNLIVDTALFFSAVGVTLSGFMVSRAIAGALGLVFTPSALWTSVHSFTADFTIALLVVHFVLHWKWITSVARRMARPAMPPARAQEDR